LHAQNRQLKKWEKKRESLESELDLLAHRIQEERNVKSALKFMERALEKGASVEKVLGSVKKDCAQQMQRRKAEYMKDRELFVNTLSESISRGKHRKLDGKEKWEYLDEVSERTCMVSQKIQRKLNKLCLDTRETAPDRLGLRPYARDWKEYYVDLGYSLLSEREALRVDAHHMELEDLARKNKTLLQDKEWCSTIHKWDGEKVYAMACKASQKAKEGFLCRYPQNEDAICIVVDTQRKNRESLWKLQKEDKKLQTSLELAQLQRECEIKQDETVTDFLTHEAVIRQQYLQVLEGQLIAARLMVRTEPWCVKLVSVVGRIRKSRRKATPAEFIAIDEDDGLYAA